VSLQAATHPGINTALWGLDLQSGDIIVTTDEEHPGVTIPLRIVAERLGVEVQSRPFPSTPEKLNHFSDYTNSVASGGVVRAIVISHVSWLTGDIVDICALRKLVPAGVRIIVDGAQSAGAMEIAKSVAASDAYTVSGQKWTLGPNGSGGLILADPEAWRPTYGGFFAVENPAEPSSSPYRNTGERFEVGMESMIPLVGLTTSLRFLLDEVGVNSAQAHSMELNAQLRADLTDGVCPSLVTGPAHLLCIALKDGGAPAVCDELLARGFQTRPVGDCVVRASLGFWNTPEETSSLARELCNILAPISTS
jgi:L-cysteine/cystine lyase